jgi:O-antigen/teichoic acid export membrane protein
MSGILVWARNFSTSKFVREVSILQVGKSLSLVAGFVGTVVFARLLGPSQYGIYAIIISLAGVISALINFGVWPSTVTLISEAAGRGDRQEVKNLIIYFLKIQLVVTDVFWLLVIVFAPQLVGRFYGNPSLAFYLQLTALLNAISIPLPLLTLQYQILRRMKQVTTWETLKKILGVGGGVVLVFSGWGVEGIFYGLLIAESVFLIYATAMMFVVPKRFPIFPTVPEILSDFWRVKLVKYLKFGLQIAVDKNLNNLVGSAPGFLLGMFSTPEQAGFFKVAYGVGSLPAVFSSNISRMLSSVLPYKEAERAGSVRSYYHKVAKYGTLFAWGSIVAVAFGTWFLFTALFGASFRPALPALVVVLFTNLLMGFEVSFGPIVRTLKKVNASIALNILALALTAAIGYAAIPRFGALGAALSMAGWLITSVFLIIKIEVWLKRSDQT